MGLASLEPRQPLFSAVLNELGWNPAVNIKAVRHSAAHQPDSRPNLGKHDRYGGVLERMIAPNGVNPTFQHGGLPLNFDARIRAAILMPQLPAVPPSRSKLRPACDDCD